MKTKWYHWIGMVGALAASFVQILDFANASVNGLLLGSYVSIAYTNIYGEHWFELCFFIMTFVLFASFVINELRLRFSEEQIA